MFRLMRGITITTNKPTPAGDSQLPGKFFRLNAGEQELITGPKCSCSSLILIKVKSMGWGQGWFHANSETGTKAEKTGYAGEMKQIIKPLCCFSATR